MLCTRIMRQLCLGLGWFLLAASLHAQAPPLRPGGVGQSPTNPLGSSGLSPYLNLLRGGNTAVNYYGLVRPQQELNSQVMQLQQQALQPGVGNQGLDPNELQIPTTGQPVRFLAYGQYFMTLTPGTGSGSSPQSGLVFAGTGNQQGGQRSGIGQGLGQGSGQGIGGASILGQSGSGGGFGGFGGIGGFGGAGGFGGVGGSTGGSSGGGASRAPRAR